MNLQCWAWCVALLKACSARSAFRATWEWCGWRRQGAGPGALDLSTTNALRTFLLMPVPSVPVGTVFFAVGSTIFSYLLLRGRMVPVWIAGLSLFASGLLALVLPLQVAGFSTWRITGYYQWLPALVAQTALALWLLIKVWPRPVTR